MHSRGVMFLLLVAGLCAPAAHWLALQFTSPGFGRTLAFGLGLAVFLFPAARFAEKRGWISGTLRIGRDAQKAPRPAQATPSEGPAGAPKDEETRQGAVR